MSLMILHALTILVLIELQSTATAASGKPALFSTSTFCLPSRFSGVTMVISLLSYPSSMAITRGIQKVRVFLKPVVAHVMTSQPA